MKKVWDGALVLVCFRAALVQNWIGKGAVIICAGIGRKLSNSHSELEQLLTYTLVSLVSRPKL